MMNKSKKPKKIENKTVLKKFLKDLVKKSEATGFHDNVVNIKPN